MKTFRTAFALAVLSLLGCGDGRTPLVVYSPHGGDLLSLMEKSFEAKHPKVDVRWLDMGSQDVYDRVKSEAANPQADVWFGGPQAILGRAGREGLLAAYRPQWAGSIPPESQGPQDLFFASYRTAPVLVYNSKAVSEADAPRDWDDLLDPKWKASGEPRLRCQRRSVSSQMVTSPSWRFSFSIMSAGCWRYSLVWPSSRRSHSKPRSGLPVSFTERERTMPNTVRIVPLASGSRIRILSFHFGSRRSSQSWGASASETALEL
jgi:hypothetical protein